MKLFAFAFAVLAVCRADRLDRTYLPPAGADTAGGSDGALSAPSGHSGAGQDQSFGPQSHSSRPQSQSFGPQSQSLGPQSHSSRPQSQSFGPQSLGPQSHSSRPQSQSFGPQSQSLGPQSHSSRPQSQSFGPQSLGPQSHSSRPQSQSFGPQSQSLGPQSHSSRPQSQSFSPQSQSFGPQLQSFEGDNAFKGSPNPSSNFGPSNGGHQSANERPQSNYHQNNQRPQYSQGPASEPGSKPAGRDTFNGSPNPNINYDAPNNDYQVGNGNYQARNERPQASQDANAAILRSDSNIDGDSFAYSFETENGISAEENGVATNGVQAQGSFSYTGDDGQFYSITYTADENGYRPVGDHLPTPPPIPDAILRSIEENARAAAANPGANYDEHDTSNDQNYNGNGSPGGLRDRPSANGYQGSHQGSSQGVPNAYGPPTNRSPAHQQPDRQNNRDYNRAQGFEGPNGNDNNNQYSSPSRLPGQSRFPGSEPQKYTNDVYRNGPQQDSYDGNAQQGPATRERQPNSQSNEAGYPSARPSRPSSEDFGGASNNNQFGQRRPSASFSTDSGYKY